MMLRTTMCLIGVALLLSVGAFAATWNVPGDFPTIQAAIDDAGVANGDTILVAPGMYYGAVVDKGVEIRGAGKTIINDGPPHPSGRIQGFRLVDGSRSASFSHLGFQVQLPIMNADSVLDVNVSDCRFEGAVQGISNWGGSGWEISHNLFRDLRTDCGGGIAVLVGDFENQVAAGNRVAANSVLGTLKVKPGDCGGYAGTGVVLFADYRFGRVGANAVGWNRVEWNRIDMVSDTPGVVDIRGIELTDTRDDPNATPFPVILGNQVRYNNLDGTVMQIVLTPAELEDCNDLLNNPVKGPIANLQARAIGPD